MKILIQWQEKRETRTSECELPTDKTWEELQEYIKELILGVYRYNEEEIPQWVIKADGERKERWLKASNDKKP